ncbi:CIC11C00000000081 [Sungouiella intermedia]|uniref:CIC11C00000000081 n=1 Tax=Sungouiella intermedia TaxID=45354 RepID=A0A1L0BEG4_9ASCO|nr:CIC11C00000000081 [[Candida] intermedia]
MSDPRTRIISHMNKDHQLALLDYVVVYGGENVSHVDAESVIITDVSEEHLALSYNKENGNNQDLKLIWEEVPENEKVKVDQMGDIKAKLVAMAKYAAEKQGFSHKRVDKVSLPKKLDLYLMYLAFAVSLATLYDKTLVRRLVQNDKLLRTIAAKCPELLAKGYSYIENHITPIFSTIYGIHVVEILTVTWPRVNKLRMSLKNKLVWATMNFVEGFLVFSRLNKLEE